MAGAAEYGTVSLTFWNDRKVRGWSDDERLLALYLLTNPRRSFEGFFHLSLRAAADDLGWPDERFATAMDKLRAVDFCDYDDAARLLLLVKGLKYQKIKGEPSIKGAIRALERTKGSDELFGRFLAAADAYQPEFADAIRKHYDLPEGPYRGAR